MSEIWENPLENIERKSGPLTPEELRILLAQAQIQQGLMTVIQWDGPSAVRVLVLIPKNGTYACLVYHAEFNIWTIMAMPHV